MQAKTAPSSTYARIYGVVRRIPRGRVATYGQVAELAGLRAGARQVGYALHALARDAPVPWQRVINAQGRISLRSEWGSDQIQRKLLESEGVLFDPGGRVDLLRYRWCPRASTRETLRR
jgi:methylated-DNA-protein-cysteine methyltransferase-like protein